jgi:hypothetical protein
MPHLHVRQLTSDVGAPAWARVSWREQDGGMTCYQVEHLETSETLTRFPALFLANRLALPVRPLGVVN